MQFDLTTFILEIVNFLVLVWILARLLYRPVTAAIAERKAGIEQTLERARTTQAEAQALREQYEHRMQDWEQEKARARAGLHTELDAERATRVSRLQTELDEERARASALQNQHAVELRQRLESQAWSAGARFAAQLLGRLASPLLEERIHQLALDDLAALGEAEQLALRAASRASDGRIEVTSAWPLAEARKASLAQALGTVVAREVQCTFSQDPDLVAGLRIGIGPWLLRANLHDELKFFAEAHRAG